jgi:hypothetical protein
MRRVRRAAIVGCALAACTGEISVSFLDAGGGDANVTNASLSIVSPSGGDVFARDATATDGAFVAPIEFRAQASAEVARVEWMAEGTYPLGTGLPPDFAVTYDYRGDGERWVDALGLDAEGREVARASVDFVVTPPAPSDCHGAMDLAGITYETGPDNPGVPNPVTVSFPLSGIEYRYVSSSSPRNTWMMDCELALALHRASELFAQRGVREVADIGVYNYRCIDQSVEPPDCPGSQLSMHAYAQAIDIAGFTTDDGTFYSVNDDWVIDPDTEDTCAAPTVDAKDAFLHEIVCAMYGDSIFNILLTPNYNSAHRNHFHVDLTEGARFLERLLPGGPSTSPGLGRTRDTPVSPPSRSAIDQGPFDL